MRSRTSTRRRPVVDDAVGRLRLPSAATAGAITTRAAAEAFFIAGTNRAMFRFTLINHLCMDMEQVHDTSIIPDRIRQDVSRSPGGDSRVFLNNCIGCHAGMDPLAQAFAYYDYDETAGTLDVHARRRCSRSTSTTTTTFADGFVTPDDSLEQPLAAGPERRARLELGSAGHRATARSRSAQELASSDAFAQCQVDEGVQGGLLARAGRSGRPRRRSTR